MDDPGVPVTGVDAMFTLDDLADTVRQFGSTEGRAVYAGVRVDHRRALLVVHRVSGADFDRRVRSLLPAPVTIAFQDAIHSRIELDAARERVWDLPGSEDIVSLTVPIDGSTVCVNLNGNAEAAQTWLDIVLPGLVTVCQAR